MLVNGKWDPDANHTTVKNGQYLRPESQFRDWITPDGSSGFKAESGRYHLYVSYSCPWAHRALLMRSLKGLDEVIDVSVATSSRKDQGWMFTDEPGCIPDTVNGKTFLHELYSLADHNVTGRPTVPTLWDKERKTIVNNESSEIIRMFNDGFSGLVDDTTDFYPKHLRSEIDEVNAVVYENVNNGVYRAGFAKSQEAYEQWVDRLFSTLEMLESRLNENRYLCGDQLTEADWRLFPTLIRFDLVYHVHFKCTRKRIVDYPNLSNYTRELYQVPGVAEQTNFEHIKLGYYANMPAINPTKIVAVSPELLDFSQPHDRHRLFNKHS